MLGTNIHGLIACVSRTRGIVRSSEDQEILCYSTFRSSSFARPYWHSKVRACIIVTKRAENKLAASLAVCFHGPFKLHSIVNGRISGILARVAEPYPGHLMVQSR